MNLKINGYKENNQIFNKNYICKNHGGNSKLPKISWEKVDKVKSYALILEDIDANNYIHLYIPYIKNTIQNIEDINIKNMNTLKNKIFNLTNNEFVFPSTNKAGHIVFKSSEPLLKITFC